VVGDGLADPVHVALDLVDGVEVGGVAGDVEGVAGDDDPVAGARFVAVFGFDDEDAGRADDDVVDVALLVRLLRGVVLDEVVEDVPALGAVLLEQVGDQPLAFEAGFEVPEHAPVLAEPPDRLRDEEHRHSGGDEGETEAVEADDDVDPRDL